MVRIVILEMLARLFGFLEDVLAPRQQLQAEILALPLIHERLPVRRTIDLVEGPDGFAVLIRCFVGSTVLAFRRLHDPLLRAHDRAKALPEARSYSAGL